MSTNKVAEYITQERLAVLPTAPEIRDELYVYNAEWWADNRAKVLEKWASWLLQ